MTNQPSEKRKSNPQPAVYPEYAAGAAQKRGAGCGCWFTGIVTAAIALGLITIGLFLPPVNLLDRLNSPAYVMLAQAGGSLTQDGLSLAAPDASSDFGVAVHTQTGNVSIPVADHALSGYVYHILSTGTAPDSVALNLMVSPDLDGAQVDLYGWNNDGSGIQFIPSTYNNGQLSASLEALPQNLAVLYAYPDAQPEVLVSVEVTQVLSPDVSETATIVSPAGLQPTLTGSLTGSLAAGFSTNAAYRVIPVIRNFADPRATDPQTITTILSNGALRETHASQIAAFAASGYDGVMIDYRDLLPEQRDNFTALIRAIARNLANTGLSLGVVLPAPIESSGAGWDTGAYDWAALGQAADLIQIRLNHDPTLFGSTDSAPINQLLSWAVSQVERDKLLLNFSALSQREVNGIYSPIGIEQALSALGNVAISSADLTEGGIVPPGEVFSAALDGYTGIQSIDESAAANFIEYRDANDVPVSRVWLTTPAVLIGRLSAVTRFGLGGVAFDDLNTGGAAAGVLSTIMAYKLGLPFDAPSDELALHWTIQGAEGTAVGEVITRLNDSLVATIESPPGNYAVNVAVVQGDVQQAQRAGAAVAVFAPTFTPSPTMTPSPTNTPPPTNTPLPALPVTVAAAPQAAAAAPAAGSIVGGNFEYGGHVTSAQTNARDHMRRAGMNWMKVQFRYFPGMSASEAGQVISDAHGHGFKILLGIVGSPADLASGGTGYMQDFAGFLASVASYGPDAIEVWNEPNLDREWPEGRISGAAYAEMLRLAYNAIKNSNPGVMVISGAPAPTGAEAAYPGRVMNDDRWVSELVAAGGLQYMDCLGAHYNEGIVPPSAYSGDPRDNYYTRYFGGMLDTYWNLIGGQRPICFTELGYLTPEGFPPLPSYFSWAQNVTLAQQAAWIAEAAALCSQSGRVRLMIVWNIDFTAYDSDPQAGYAIVRPGGGCPACDALAGAR